MSWWENLIKVGTATLPLALPPSARPFVAPVASIVTQTSKMKGEDSMTSEADRDLERLVASDGPASLSGLAEPDRDLAIMVMGAAPAPQPDVLAQLAQIHLPAIASIAQTFGLANKQKWSAHDVDGVAAALMRNMMSSTGQPPDAADAQIARNTVKAVVQKAGGAVIGGDDVVGFSLTSFVKTALNPLTPLKATFWLGKKGVQGVASAASWAGRKLGITHSAPSQAQQYASAQQRLAAAQQRINAANKAQEDAIYAQQQAQDAADAQEQAEETEAAASAAEQVAAQAQAQAGVVSGDLSLDGYLYDHRRGNVGRRHEIGSRLYDHELSEILSSRRHHPWHPGS